MDTNQKPGLEAAPLKRQPEFTGASMEARALEQTLALLNSIEPSIVPDKKPEPLAPKPEPAYAAPKAAPNRIFLTGRSGVGKSFLASQVNDSTVLELLDPLDEYLRSAFPDIPTGDTKLDSIRLTLRVWGDGYVDEKFPITPARMLFIGMIIRHWPDFGSPGFWVRELVKQAGVMAGQVIVTRVESGADFRALVEAGFKHYHVACSTTTYATRPRRKSADDRLASKLDQDVVQKISAHRQGPRLNTIWNDPAVRSPSDVRVFSTPQWLQEMAIASSAAIE